MEVTLPITDGMKITKKGVNHREGRRSLKCCESIELCQIYGCPICHLAVRHTNTDTIRKVVYNEHLVVQYFDFIFKIQIFSNRRGL